MYRIETIDLNGDGVEQSAWSITDVDFRARMELQPWASQNPSIAYTAVSWDLDAVWIRLPVICSPMASCSPAAITFSSRSCVRSHDD